MKSALHIPRSFSDTYTETAQPPSISSPVWFANSGTGANLGIILMVDSDVPRNGTRVQLVHWVATNVSLATPLNIPAAPVPYLQPSPPVGDVPHAYTFMLFPQPANFSIPAAYANLSMNRVGFNTSKFVADAGLVNPLAANYIRVQNLTGSATTSFPPPRATATPAANTSSPAQFTGAVQPLMVGGATFWACVSTALLTGVAAFAL